MTYTNEPLTEELLRRLFANLWERGKEELTRLGLSQEEAINRFLGYAQGYSESAVLCADGEPVAVIGVTQEDGDYFTWFQATENFRKHWKPITRFLKRQTAGRDGLHVYSVLVHDEAERWFNLLGFYRDGWCVRTNAGFPLYRFSRGS